MKSLRISSGAFCICVAAVMLGGCAALTGVPGGTPIGMAMQKQSGLTYSLLYSFGSSPTDAVNPEANLTNLDGILYGTTLGGGSGCYASGGCGTVFAIATSGAESILHSFKGGEDGALPYAGLTNANGVLYGTTGGGASNDGTVFSITTSGAETVLHHFENTPDGSDPHAGLLNDDGTLYGSTVFGGSARRGVIFQMTTSGGETVLYSFLGTHRRHHDGKYPNASLLNDHGTLYGTTYKGGTIDRGTVFKITPSGNETVLHGFEGGPKDGSFPRAGLVYVKGALYGTTSGGGNAGCYGCGKNPGDGTIFKITKSGTEKLVYEFKGYPKDGAVPYGQLLYQNGVFYGTTQSGGANCAVSHGCGTIFSITPSGKERVLYSFLPNEGAFPVAGLIEVNGTFYGTTPTGGAYNQGVVFSFSAPNSGGHAK
jgi:uncharacterized repeat protein (TIGR03803 family)